MSAFCVMSGAAALACSRHQKILASMALTALKAQALLQRERVVDLLHAAACACHLQWCSQGVLLLNAALTVRAKNSNSHAGGATGWVEGGGWRVEGLLQEQGGWRQQRSRNTKDADSAPGENGLVCM